MVSARCVARGALRAAADTDPFAVAVAAGVAAWAGRFAGRPAAMPRRDLCRYAAGPDPAQRQHAAAFAPPAMLVRLVGDPVPRVRASVAARRAARGAPFAALMGSDGSVGVSLTALGNPSCPSWALDRLRASGPLLAGFEPWWPANGVGVGRWLLDRGMFWRDAGEAGPLLVRLLARSRSVGVKAAAAGNGRCPPGVLDRLAGCPHARVRRAVASNPATPARALRRLVADPDVVVRSHARGVVVF